MQVREQQDPVAIEGRRQFPEVKRVLCHLDGQHILHSAFVPADGLEDPRHDDPVVDVVLEIEPCLPAGQGSMARPPLPQTRRGSDNSRVVLQRRAIQHVMKEPGAQVVYGHE